MVAAVGSWLDARAHGGEWRLRIDDLDEPRVVPGAAEGFFRTLERFGLGWDGPVLFQSKQRDLYEDTLRKLKEAGLTFPCNCTRKVLSGQEVYPGTCRFKREVPARSVRFKSAEGNVVWQDLIAGEISYQVGLEIGDFLLRNSHQVFSYHLANVADDAMWNVSHVIRGADLIPATAAQLLLMDALKWGRPMHGHLPLAFNNLGQKLSKQTLAPSVDVRPVHEVLISVLEHLGYRNVPIGSASEILDWALNHWLAIRQSIEVTR